MTGKDSGMFNVKLIKRPKAAEQLGVCARTLVRYEKLGLLTPHKINCRVTSYPESEVQLLIEKSRPAHSVAESESAR